MSTRSFIALAIGTSTLFAGTALGAVAYDMQFQTHYDNGAPGDSVGGIGGQPDTGYVRFANPGITTFTGTFGLSGLAGNGQVIALTFVGSLLPGGAFSLVAGPESSNAGGFNKVANAADLGLLVTFVGSVSDGVNTDDVSFSCYDSEIHSGQPRLSVFGDVTLDNYVLQGSDPFGRDAGDPFELGAAPGIKDFIVTPAPGAAMLLGLGGIVAGRRRR